VVELNTRKIVARLKSDGWIDAGGAKHDKFEHPDHQDTLIILPRHKEQSPGVARNIAKQAGWI
jgi:predicted RNA binding protein YcfA (HicA-like mRNA interferase family)